jgi:hypothetical protein
MSRHDLICYVGLGVVVLENVFFQAVLVWISRRPDPAASGATEDASCRSAEETKDQTESQHV